MGKEMVTGNVAVKTERIMPLLLAWMGSESDIDSDVGADVMIRGRGFVVRLVHCRF